MRKILKIAKLELSLLFYSPIAWLVLIIFFIQTGLTFTDLLYKYETNQQLERPLQVLTKILFAGDDGILAKVQQHLYLYIPLLTMGLMSKELSSGSIKLLYSSPVKISEIIFGKYLAMMVYNLFLAAILASFILVANYTIVALDIPFVLGGILGIYLLMCVYSAIGLFMSSLTSYQVVAAISTLAILAILNFIGSIGQAYDFIREITYWMSINGRADYFVNGLITTRDFIYFILVISLFLALCILRLNNQRKTRSTGMKIGMYIGLIAIIMGIGYFSALPTLTGYLDTTRNQDRTLSKTSQEIIQSLEHDIHLTTYVNIIHPSSVYGAPENRIKDEQRFENYRRFIPKMKMDYVYYYDSIPYRRDTLLPLEDQAKKAAKALHLNFDKVLTPKEIRQKIDLVKEGNRLVRFIKYGDQTIPLRMFDDIFVYPNETDISSTLKRLIQPASEVGMLIGQGERDTYKNGDDSYKFVTKGLNIRGSLINAGYNVNDVDLSLETTPIQDSKAPSFDTEKLNLSRAMAIDTNLSVLVIADPKRAFTHDELAKINDYIEAGGNLLIAGEPGQQDILNPLINPLGVTFNEGTLLQESRNFELDLIQSLIPKNSHGPSLNFYDGAVVVSPKAGILSYADTTDYTIEPILITNKTNTWLRTTPFDLNTEKITFDPNQDERIEAPTALALTRKRQNGTEQKIVVIADADFMSNAQAQRNRPSNVNMSFTIRLFKWFSDNEYPISTGKKRSIDTKILVNRTEIMWLKILLLGIIPLAIGIVGSVVLLKRRRN
ncbi:Gldg family protein [Flavobacteriaceae bacterium F08102]|nr:Gldg family protein [Flavobacteriaceae bacterium F08102]